MADSILDLAGQIMSSNTGRGAALGALMSALLKAYPGAGGVNTGVDMSKVGAIAPRATVTPTGRYVPYSEYGAQDVQTPTLTPELARVLGLPANLQLPTAAQYTAQPRMITSALPRTITSPGTGAGATIKPTLTPKTDVEINPLIGALLGASMGYLMPATEEQTAAGKTASNAMGELYKRAAGMFGGTSQGTTTGATGGGNVISSNPSIPGVIGGSGTFDNAVSSIGNVINTGGFNFRDGGMATPLMADGGAADSPSYYTFGQIVNPMDIMSQANQMAQGGLPRQGGLHVPTVEGRHDYRAGARVSGEGDGQSDDIPAMLADGEYVFDADTVAQLGNGSTKAGSDLLDKFREEIRGHKRSAPLNKIPPPSKSPLAYLAAAQKKIRS